MSESWKWRSGRVVVRVVVSCSCARGGKRSHLFSDQEGIASERHSDVMMPSNPRATFVVVETQFALEVLVGAFDAPSAFENPYELNARDTRWK